MAAVKGQSSVDHRNPAAAAMRSGRGRVLDRRVSATQRTAEQLLEESRTINARVEHTERPTLVITSKAELEEHRVIKRADFEGLIRRDVHLLSSWLKAAAWEAAQGDLTRMRSLFERGADYHSGAAEFWKGYAQEEMRAGQLVHARNVLERAVATLPASGDTWLLFLLVEQTVGNTHGARELFERWMAFSPLPDAWELYAEFELGQGDPGRVRSVLARFVAAHNSIASWLYYSRCELEMGSPSRAIDVLTTATAALPAAATHPGLLKELARLLSEAERLDEARSVYQRALSTVDGTADSVALYAEAAAFERRHGTPDQIWDLTSEARRIRYASAVQRDPADFDAWTALIQLRHGVGAPDSDISALFDRACFGDEPEEMTLAAWLPLAVLWEAYAAHLEKMGDIEGAGAVLRKAVARVTRLPFALARTWLALASLHSRCGNVDGARKVLAAATQTTPTAELFRRQVELETESGGSVRGAYDAFVAAFPSDVSVRGDYARFVDAAEGHAAGDAVLEQALQDGRLTDKSALWISLITRRVQRTDFAGARAAYSDLAADAASAAAASAATGAADEGCVCRLLKAHDMCNAFELSVAAAARDASATAAAEERCRELFRRSSAALRAHGLAAALPLLHHWQEFEARHGGPATQREVADIIEAPQRKRSKLFAMAGGY